MTTNEFNSLCAYVMARKAMKKKQLAEELNISYTYFTKVLNGQQPHSTTHEMKILDFCERAGMNAEEGKKWITPLYNVPDSSIEKVEGPDNKSFGGKHAMVPGAEMEITTRMRLANDIVTQYNVEIKRIS